MSWDIRYFHFDAAAAGLSFDGSFMWVPGGDYALAGEVGGAEFGALADLGGGLFNLMAGTSTLTGPSGTPEVILAVSPNLGPAFLKEGVVLPSSGTTSIMLLESGTVVLIESQPAGDTYAGLLPDTLRMASTSYLMSWNFSFTADRFTGSFGGAAGMTCFVAGTRIATPTGARPVEALRPGDLVLTRDRGYRPLRWCGRRRLSAARLAAADRLRPVRIAAGALAPGVPARDLWVSPQHRILLAGPRIAERFGCAEVLAAARQLLGWPGMTAAPRAGGIAYHHLLFDAHELVLAEGAWTESLFTGPMALRMMPAAQRAEIFTLFPVLRTGRAAHAAPARRFLTGAEARALRPAAEAAGHGDGRGEPVAGGR